jgi:hypothetical protein
MSHSVFEQGLLATDGSPKTHEGDLSSEKELLILHTSWHREAFVDGDTITAVWHAFGGEYNDDGSQTAPRQMTSLRFVASWHSKVELHLTVQENVSTSQRFDMQSSLRSQHAERGRFDTDWVSVVPHSILRGMNASYSTT